MRSHIKTRIHEQRKKPQHHLTQSAVHEVAIYESVQSSGNKDQVVCTSDIRRLRNGICPDRPAIAVLGTHHQGLRIIQSPRGKFRVFMIYSGIESEFVINQKLPPEDVVRCSMLEITLGCDNVLDRKSVV